VDGELPWQVAVRAYERVGAKWQNCPVTSAVHTLSPRALPHTRPEPRTDVSSRAVWLPTAVCAVLCLAYLLLPRMGNDLAAQIARADFARDHPLALIDFRWFGGTLPFGYSFWTPFLMAVIGTKITGALATVGSVAIFSRLLVVAKAPHALLGGMTATVSLAANLIEGRTTFAVGVVFGLAAVLALTRRDGTGRPLAVLLTLFGAAASPVAALFLGLCAVTLILTNAVRDGLLLGVSAALPMFATTVIFADPGRQIFNRETAIQGIAMSLLVALCVNQRRIRVGAVLSAILVLGSFALSSPVGSNSLRLSMLFGLPLLLAYLRMDGQMREWRVPFWVYATAVGILAYFVQPFILAGTLGGMGRPATYPSYYTPLVQAIQERGPVTGRVEVPEITGHWDAAFLADQLPLARGWLRQVDTKLNGDVFYGYPATPDIYRAFLDRSAVQYVAISDSRGTFTGGKEKRLIQTGLPYLRPVWANGHWTLYEVIDPTTIVDSPGALISAQSGRIVFDVQQAGNVTLRVRPLRFLSLSGPSAGCLQQSDGDAVVLVGAVPGVYTLSSSLAGRSRWC
jgi:hypothetical protein